METKQTAPKPLFGANWKMHKTVNEAIEYIAKFKELIANVHEADILIVPPFTALPHCSNDLKGTNIYLGAQNMFYEDKGAFTGEISPKMLQELGCAFVVVGHSERRRWFSETDTMVNRKVLKALERGLHPLFCIGETEQEREEQETQAVITTQLEFGLEKVTAEQLKQIVIAYEPVWAIGTGKTATPKQAQEMHVFIRSWLSQKFGQTTAQGIRILYGGSVTPDNINELMTQPDINGGFVGTASLDPESFAKIVKFSHG